MTVNKVFKKFPIGSIIVYDVQWWESWADRKEGYGLVIHADQTQLYVLMSGVIVKLNKWAVRNAKVVQKPYQKHV